MDTRSPQERGQAIVFLVVGMIVFLGFVALAIDGGMAYADRRNAQNASDSASLAGGGITTLELENRGVLYTQWNCNDAQIQAAMAAGRQAAINRAAANGYSIDENIADHHGVQTVCGETNYGYLDRWIDLTVQLSDTTSTSFAHLLFPAAVEIRVDATTRIRPRQPLAFGNAIIALNPEDCQGHQSGAIFYGTADIFVTGGGVWSNGCLRADGTPLVEVTNGEIHYVAEYNSGSGVFSPPPTKVDYTLPPESYQVPPPDCTGRWYTDDYLVDPKNQPLRGLYCIQGNLHVNAHDVLVGYDVTIYVPNGEVRINGNATVQVDAPPQSPDPSPAIPGVVLYVDVKHTHDIQINGNSDSYWEGTILAPNTDIELNGTGFQDAYRTQVIGWNVKVGGTADTYVRFEEQKLYSRPTSLELAR